MSQARTSLAVNKISMVLAAAGLLIAFFPEAADYLGLTIVFLAFEFNRLLVKLLGLILVLFALSFPMVAGEEAGTRLHRTLWRITGSQTWRLLSLILFFLSIAALSCFIHFYVIPNYYGSSSASRLSLYTKEDKDVCEISIPVRFLPDYDIEKSSDGTIKKTLKYGRGVIEARSDEVALVLVDCWEYESHPIAEPSGHYKNIAALLKKCRKHGVTVIHAPNHPVVDKYQQYHRLRMKVNELLKPARNRYEILDTLFPAKKSEVLRTRIYNWPPASFSKNVREMRREAKRKHYMDHPRHERDIVHFLRPEDDEFVLESSDEFRFVLWKRKIKLLLYVGGATNQCILHRPTGVLGVRRNNYVIVLLSDCTSPSPSPWCEREVVQRVFEDYYMRKIGYVANSKNIAWKDLE